MNYLQRVYTKIPRKQNQGGEEWVQYYSSTTIWWGRGGTTSVYQSIICTNIESCVCTVSGKIDKKLLIVVDSRARNCGQVGRVR